MDFPMFFLDFFGNRILIAVIAIVHVMVNHPLAVGAYPLVVLMEWWGRRKGSAEWDELARKITFVLFIVTTSVGALTGVGIWLATALIAPFGIGSLLRVFFWAWFTEWTVFISEVVLVMIYYLTWKRWTEGIWKKVHIGVGVVLAVCSWFTMMIIVAILGFMMGTGNWTGNHNFLSAVLNPLYFPQLAFRTALAMLTAGFYAWFLIFFFTKKHSEFREKAVRFTATWMFVWVGPCLAAAIWYWNAVPAAMLANVPVGLLTQKFMSWHETFAMIIALAVFVIIVAILFGLARPRLLPAVMLIIPFVLGLWMLGHFERVREFIRKPFVIADYMYSNGIKVSEMPVFKRDGFLPYATYVKNHTVTDANLESAGRDVFIIACSRCHTSTDGINGVTKKFRALYGNEPWDKNVLMAFIATMHNTRTFMPPFPGSDREAEALVAYIKQMQVKPEAIVGAQAGWTPKPLTTQGAQTAP